MAEFQNDDHPNIIKMPDELPTSKFGLGYELFHSMKKYSKNIAQYIVKTDESKTYAALLEDCIKVALNLKAENLSDDDIVGLCLDNHENACVPYIASLFLGIKVLPIDNVLAIPEEQSELLQKVTPKIIFVDEHMLLKLEKILEIAKLHIKLVVVGEKSNGHPTYADFLVASISNVTSFQPIKLNSNKGTAVIFTGSGTSGSIRGICLSHHTLLTRTAGDDSIPVSISFSEVYWASYVLATFRALRSGSAWVVMNDSEVANIWTVIEKYKVFAIFGTVFQVSSLLNIPKAKDVDISSFKFLAAGGTAFPVDVLQKLRKFIPGVVILPAYGLTELGGSTLFFDLTKAEDREFLLKKPTSCGKPFQGLWYKVVDPDTGEILGPNQQGELRLKSNLMMVGYYNMDSSEAYDSAGWLKTGDLFEYDEDHCFFMIERMREMIRFRQYLISPTILEHILMQHPLVDAAAVIGIPNPEGGDYPIGIVTLRKNCEVDPKELEEYVNDRVIDRQRLRGGVKIIQDMPLTGTDKILKRTLRKMIMNGEL